MNGPEHYREAERLLAEAKKPPTINLGADVPAVDFKPSEATLVVDDGLHVTDFRVAMAQVHATLALVAAERSPGDVAWSELWGATS